jgi:hypothetical protein
VEKETLMRPLVVQFIVTGTLPLSMNRLLRTHWAKRKRLAEEYGLLMLSAISKADIRCLKAWKDWGYKVRVEMHVVTPKLYDPAENLPSLAKWPMDIMVNQFGWLAGDSAAHVEFSASQEIGKKKSITFRIAPIVPEEK